MYKNLSMLLLPHALIIAIVFYMVAKRTKLKNFRPFKIQQLV